LWTNKATLILFLYLELLFSLEWFIKKVAWGKSNVEKKIKMGVVAKSTKAITM
jgi:hypothetical protein